MKKRTETLAYKEPCKTHNVNYRDIHNQLMNTKISEDREEDKLIKQLVGVVNYGLFEKGGSTSYTSFPYKHLQEALENQADYGGRLHTMTKIEENEEGYEREAQRCYVLNLKDKAELKDGFRWIKELILQMHDFNMYDAYQKLKKNGIEVYSVRTDAFVIDRCNFETVKEILDFHDDVGGSRVSKKNNDIIFPTVEYHIVENERVDIPVVECSKELYIQDEYDSV